MYLLPDVQLKLVSVMVLLAPLAKSMGRFEVVAAASSIVAEEIVNVSAPVFVQAIAAVVLVGNVMPVIFSSSVFMKVKVSAPIQAATAMETATVTAISMIAATTGLKAFLLFRSFFIFGFIPPFRVHKRDNTLSRSKSYDLRH